MLHTHLPQLLGGLVIRQFETDRALILLHLTGNTLQSRFRSQPVKEREEAFCFEKPLTSDGLILMKKLLRL